MTAVPSYLEAGTGTPVILLHGVGGRSDSWRPQLDGLSDRWRVVAWDMPSYDGKPLDGPLTFEMTVSALNALIDDLGGSPVHLVGHSLGGMVAQEFAVNHQDRLKSLTLFATSPAFGRPDGDFQKKFVADRLRPLDEGQSMADIARGAVIEGLLGPDPDPAAAERAVAAMSVVPPEAYRQAVQCIVGFDCRHNLPNLSVPTLVLAGDQDANAPAPMMEKMATKIPGAVYRCMPGTGHLGNLEHPDDFNAVIHEFLLKTEED